MDYNDVLKWIMFVLGLVAYTAGTGKFFLDRIDNKVEKEAQSRDLIEASLRAEVIRVYEEIAKIKDSYVRRDDFRHHVEYMEKNIMSLTTMMNQFSMTVNSRLDSLVMLLTKQKTE